MDQLSPQLTDFIVDYCNRYKVVPVDTSMIKPDTSLDLDLDIYDIEIDLFLSEFAEYFKIDKSKFSWYKYGYPKGSTRVRMIKALFGYKHPLVKKLTSYCYKPKFRVEVLQQALENRKLL
ncbi:MAG: DUF1493 family protein [Mucilaginibacter sp.]|nr:DUF1493 family protein [Mucilaginibacter sp.]